MTRIRTQQELKARYPDQFKVLLGYWMSGSTTKEQLDRIVKRLEDRTQGSPPTAQREAGRRTGGHTGGIQEQAPTTSKKPRKAQKQPVSNPQRAENPPHRRKKEWTPEKLVYAQKFQENRKKAGRATAYYESAITRKTPMIFRCYGGMNLSCTLLKDGGDTFTMLVDGKRQVVWKTRLQYAYKASSQWEIEKAISIDERVKGQNLKPILPRSERYQIPDAELLACKEDGHPLRLTMRGGEV